MSGDVSRKDIRMLEKVLKKSLNVNSIGSREEIPSFEAAIVNMLRSGGPALPPGRRVESIKSHYMSNALALRNKARKVATSQARELFSFRAHPAIARGLVAIMAIVILLVALGFGSAYAMPGNPLYSVKRAGESLYISLLPGNQRRAFAHAEFSERRLRELEYVISRSMERWCYPLIEDCESGLERSYEYGEKLRADIFEKVSARVRVIAERLQLFINQALGKMTKTEREKARKIMERVRIRLRTESMERDRHREDFMLKNEKRSGHVSQEGKTLEGENAHEGAGPRLNEQEQKQQQLQEQQQYQQQQKGQQKQYQEQHEQQEHKQHQNQQQYQQQQQGQSK